jgi:hypothetical protein
LKSHVLDPRIGPLAIQIGYSAPPGGDAILRAALAKNPSREAKGHVWRWRGSSRPSTPVRWRKRLLPTMRLKTLFERVLKEFSDIESEHVPLGEIAKKCA